MNWLYNLISVSTFLFDFRWRCSHVASQTTFLRLLQLDMLAMFCSELVLFTVAFDASLLVENLLEVLIVDFLLYIDDWSWPYLKHWHRLWTLMLSLMFHHSLDEDCLFRKLRHWMGSFKYRGVHLSTTATKIIWR